MTKIFNLGFWFLLLLFAFACQSPQKNQISEINSNPVSPSPTAAASTENRQTKIEVPELAGKTAAEFDEKFGKPEKITPATIAGEKPGEYRLYKLAEHPKGLSVRFYRDQAVRFNLLLGAPEKSASEALQKHFGIDIAKMRAVKGDPLSETWKGASNGVNFSTVYAKREIKSDDFVMIHAEIVR